jgi:osmotically-inducible protein OsmY
LLRSNSANIRKEKTEEDMKIDKMIEATRTALVLGFCLVGTSFGMIGCQNTAEGAKEDAVKNGAVIANAADKAVDSTKNATDNAANATKAAASSAGDVLSLTPKVKLAISLNSTLRDPKNLINVNTTDKIVFLEGHVISNDEKRLAGDIATKTVKEAGSNDVVMNQLTVVNH